MLDGALPLPANSAAAPAGIVTVRKPSVGGATPNAERMVRVRGKVCYMAA